MSSPFPIGRFLLAAALLAGCTNHPDSATEPSAKALAARQELIRNLAAHIQYYHEDDAKAAQPGWNGGGTYSFTLVPGQKAKIYHGRVAVRAALNRMLDSLKATGPVNMGNVAEETDTIPSRRLFLTSTSTSTVTSWVEGDSAATVTRRVHRGDSTVTP